MACWVGSPQPNVYAFTDEERTTMTSKRCLTAGCNLWAIPGYSRCRAHQRLRWATYNDPAYRAWPRDRACQKCGATRDLTRDHIRPVAHGGTNDPSNLRTLCRSCNSSKKDAL